MSLNQENNDISKNILNRITYLINRRLSNFNLNKIDNIYENTKTLINEFEKQHNKMNNKINVLENLIILMNKEITELKKKIKVNKPRDYIGDIDENEKKCIENLLSETKKVKKSDKESNTKKKEEIQEVEENEKLDQKYELIKTNSFNINYKEIKKEEIIIDKELAKKCLESHNISSDIKIFKNIYIENIPNSYYPIRHMKGNYQYWLNNKMNNDDEQGTYIKDTIIHNITNIYLNINVIENYGDDTELFIKNQEYVFSMTKQKYKDKFFKNILKIVEV